MFSYFAQCAGSHLLIKRFGRSDKYARIKIACKSTGTDSCSNSLYTLTNHETTSMPSLGILLMVFLRAAPQVLILTAVYYHGKLSHFFSTPILLSIFAHPTLAASSVPLLVAHAATFALPAFSPLILVAFSVHPIAFCAVLVTISVLPIFFPQAKSFVPALPNAFPHRFISTGSMVHICVTLIKLSLLITITTTIFIFILILFLLSRNIGCLR